MRDIDRKKRLHKDLDGVVDKYIMAEIAKQHPDTLVIRNLLADMMQGELPLDNIWRVEIVENHELHLTDFTMPSSSTKLKQTIPISEAPKFIQDGLAVLQILHEDDHVDGIGKRISNSVFYIVERNDGSDPREESERCS